MATILTTTGVRFTADAHSAAELQAKVQQLQEHVEEEGYRRCWVLLDEKVP